MAVLVGQWQIDRCKGRNQVLLTVILLNELIVALRQLTNFLLRCILSGRQKIRLVVRMLLKVLYLLLAVQHLPALNAEHLSV